MFSAKQFRLLCRLLYTKTMGNSQNELTGQEWYKHTLKLMEGDEGAEGRLKRRGENLE